MKKSQLRQIIKEEIRNMNIEEVKDYIKSLPDHYDMTESQYDLWGDIMDELNISKTKN